VNVAEPTRKPDRVRDHFGLLLALLVTDLIISAFGNSLPVRLLSALIYFATAFVAFRSVQLRDFHHAFVLVTVSVVGIAMVALASFDEDVTRGLGACFAAVVIAAVLATVLARVLQHDQVNVQTIAGAVCSYLLIGFLFSSIYAALDLLGSSPAFGHPVSADDYTYFSFITLTTVGYGDIVPVTDIARRLAVVEAVTAQILLVTMVTRLVSAFQPKRER
jgi:voltage-gated potassium channel Kch